MMKGKRREEKSSDPNAWMITFSDLLTLLLTFFVLLISMSTLDNKKLKRAMSFFLGAAGALEMGKSAGVGRIYVVPSKIEVAGGLPNMEKYREIMNQKRFSLEREFWEGKEWIGKIYVVPPRNLITEAWQDINLKASKREPLSESEISLRGMDVEVREEEILLRLPSSLLFNSGSEAIHPEGLDLLLWIAGRFRDFPYRIEVEGHTDNRPISTRQFPSNWELSLARSVNVVRFLEEKGRIPGSRLSAAGYADLRPISSNDTAEGRKRNRRVEIILKRIPSDEIPG